MNDISSNDVPEEIKFKLEKSKILNKIDDAKNGIIIFGKVPLFLLLMELILVLFYLYKYNQSISEYTSFSLIENELFGIREIIKIFGVFLSLSLSITTTYFGKYIYFKYQLKKLIKVK